MMKRFLTLLALISSACLWAQIPTDYIAYYPFNGNANDESGNGHNGNVNGAVLSADRFGNTNACYNFDGINDYIDIGTLNFGSKVSASLWINIETLKNFGDPLGSEKKLTFVTYADGHIHASISNGSGWIDPYKSSAGLLAENKWMHFVLTYDGNLQKFYLDGDLLSTISAGIFSVNPRLYIGARYHPSGTKYVLDGSVDDIRLYNRDLTQIEIDALYNELDPNGGGGGPSLWTENNGKIYYTSGNVGIGITNPPAKLTVNGAILGTQIKVKTDVSTFPDFVFDPEYPLMTITEVDNYIQTHGHLPDIPTAQEAITNGHDIGAMNLKLLQKIEELTLYAIQQNEQIRELRRTLECQKEEIKELKIKMKN